MYEVILTIVVPNNSVEPSHTEVWRLEFDNQEDITTWLSVGGRLAVSSEKMTAAK